MKTSLTFPILPRSLADCDVVGGVEYLEHSQTALTCMTGAVPDIPVQDDAWEVLVVGDEGDVGDSLVLPLSVVVCQL